MVAATRSDLDVLLHPLLAERFHGLQQQLPPIVLVIILIGVVFTKNYLRPARSVPADQDFRGTKLNLPGIDWAHNELTLLLVLGEKCRFCTESAPFYQRLTQAMATNSRVRLVAVLPQDVVATRQYLLSLKVPIEEVRQSSLDAIRMRGHQH